MRMRLLPFLCGLVPTLIALVIFSKSGGPSSSPPTVSHANEVHQAPVPTRAVPTWEVFSKASKEEQLSTLEALNAEQALTLLRRVSPEQSQVSQRVFDRLVELDTSKALDHAMRTWPTEERLQRLEALILRWAHEDPDTCWEWLDQHHEANQAEAWDKLLRRVWLTRSLAQPTPNEVARAWEAFEAFARSGQEGSIERTVRSKGEEHIHSYPRFGNGIIEDPMTQRPHASLWSLVNDAKQHGTWQATMDRLASFSERSVLWSGLVFAHWKAHDAAAAKAWRDQRRAQELLIPNTVRNDEARLPIDRPGTPFILGHLQWLSQQDSDDSQHDNKRFDLAEMLRRIDIEAAVTWAQTVVNESSREEAVKRTIRHWAELEPDAAFTYAQDVLGWDEEACAAVDPFNPR